jgi:hypothetical protein
MAADGLGFVRECNQVQTARNPNDPRRAAASVNARGGGFWAGRWEGMIPLQISIELGIEKLLTAE